MGLLFDGGAEGHELANTLVAAFDQESKERRVAVCRLAISSKKKKKKHTTVGIRMWSPTILLTNRRVA